MYKIFMGLWSWATLLSAGGCCSANTKCENGSLIPREILFGNPEKLCPRLSPDGTKIAYLAPDAQDVLNVWIRDVNGETDDWMVTSDRKRGIRSFLWEYTAQNILYIQDRDGDENWHLYQANLETRTTRDLTPFDGASASLLAYEPQNPHELLIKLNVRNPALFDVYRVDLEKGTLDLAVENKQNAVQWLADHKLDVRAFRSHDAEGATLVHVRENGDSPWNLLMRWGVEEEGSLLGFSRDNASLYLLSNGGSDTIQLIQVNLLDKTEQVIAADPHYDISEVLENPISHEVEAIGIEKDRFEWTLLDPKIEADFAQLLRTGETMHLVSRDRQDRRWIVAYVSDLSPARYYFYDREEKELRFLFSERPKLEGYALSEMRPISFQARDGMELHGYLTLPRGKEAKNLPTILLVHGGPWARDTWGYNRLAQWLANRGYAILQVNFRGSAGYGKKYLNAGNREWAGKMHTDLLDGKQWMIDQGYTDADRVAICGASYGGYAALVGLAFTPGEFCCGIDLVGPSNLVTLLQTIPPYWAPAKSRFDTRVGRLDTEKAFLESRSPLFLADQIARPLLIVQGANDPRVKQAESDQIVAAMRKNGQEVEYLLFADEGHGFVCPKNMLAFTAVAEKFLQKHLNSSR